MLNVNRKWKIKKKNCKKRVLDDELMIEREGEVSNPRPVFNKIIVVEAFGKVFHFPLPQSVRLGEMQVG